MQNLYGPAIVMGLIIGAAIIADDFIQPSSRNVAMPVRAQHPTPALYESDHQAWSMKQGGDEITAAAAAISGQANRIEVEVDATAVRQQSEWLKWRNSRPRWPC